MGLQGLSEVEEYGRHVAAGTGSRWLSRACPFASMPWGEASCRAVPGGGKGGRESQGEGEGEREDGERSGKERMRRRGSDLT